MKRRTTFFTLAVLAIVIVSCGENERDAKETETATVESEESTYAVFGDSISAENVISGEEMLEKYKSIHEGDTLEVKFSGTIQNVCQKKGCWMNVALVDDEVTFIRFKDYGFFMPFNAAESEAIVNGKAFVSVVSVEDLKHYAEDEGQTADEIAQITEPKVTYGFLANGVLIKE